MSQVLSQIDGLICLHEPSPELILESSAYRYGNISSIKIKKILMDTRKPVINDSIYCESNQTLSFIIPVLAETFPKARFIWLIRNGLDMIASAYQKQWYTGHSENHNRYEDCSQIEKDWINGRICGDLCGEMTSYEWTKLNRFGKCCWYWGYVNRLIETDLNKYAQNRNRMIRLEELAIELPSLIHWMRLRTILTPFPKRHNIAKRIPYKWTVWSSEERLLFEKFCGCLMDTYYPSWRTRNNEWKGVEELNFSMGTLSWFRGNYRLVASINSLFAPNRIT
jgi:hypothetical protein